MVREVSSEGWEHPDTIKFYAENRRTEAELYPSEATFFRQAVLESESMLDIGCAVGGFSAIAKSIKPSIDYLGLDRSKTAIAEAKRQFPDTAFNVMDGVRVTLPSNSFDLVVCTGVAVHERRWASLLREAYRLSKKICLFDIRLHRDPHRPGSLKIAFQGDDTGYRVPYFMVRPDIFWLELMILNPQPTDVKMHGYIKPVSSMAVTDRTHAFMAVFELRKP